MNIKVNILVAGPLPVPGKFCSDNAGNVCLTVAMAMTLLVPASYSAPGLVISLTDFTLEEDRSDSSETFAIFLPSI